MQTKSRVVAHIVGASSRLRHGEDDLDKSSINLNVKLDRSTLMIMERFFSVRQISIKYFDVCVRTGDSIGQELEIPISSVFLEQNNEKHQLEDEISIFFGERDWICIIIRTT